MAEEAGAAGGVVAVVDLDSPAPGKPTQAARQAVRMVPGVIVGVARSEGSPSSTAWTGLTDVVVTTDGQLDGLLSSVAGRPKAAAALALLLRGNGHDAGHDTGHDTEERLVAESAAYSMLQAGPEFAVWRAGRPVVAPAPESDPPVRVARDGDRLTVTLSRPARHNALNTAMRDALADALRTGLADTTATVVLEGDGPSFCSGGDLDQFGSAPDPATAHLIRLTRSPAALAARLGPRLEARVHGACLGAGVELAAFARRVVAHPDTVFALPELALGLIPGSGGTVSLPRRIGRHRTAWLALTGHRIAAAQALDWGLVDEVATTG